MPLRARVYIGIVVLVGAVLSAWAFLQGPVPQSQWLPLIALTLLTTLSQLFRAGWPGKLTLYVDNLFQFAALLLLHPFFFVLLVVTSHVAESLYERVARRPDPRPWHIQLFNVAMFIVAGFAALGIGSLVAGTRLDPAIYSARMIAAILVAATVHIFVNSFIVAFSLYLEEALQPIEAGLFSAGVWLTDFILLMMAYGAAILWTLNPWLIFLAISPLLLIYRTLLIPQLEQAAQTDAKTGLLNAQSFMERFSAAWEQAQRRQQPLTVLMTDLDLLRNINNSYGHLAGDAVLAGVGQIIRDTLRDSDIAGRFGGEEFAIVLPNVAQAEAAAVAERLRCAVQEAAFRVETSPTPIHATMSIGIASFPQDAAAPKDLIHRADVAVYQAKLQGRNCIVRSDEAPDTFTHESPAPA
ncbi:MAG TPA: GGDEF domain-containing protein [Ardenticatenaceae bacterium]